MNKIIRSALLACGLAGYALIAAAAPAIPVRVATVENAPHADERQISGRVEAIHAVDIRARTEGKIVQRHFGMGSTSTRAIRCLRWMTPSRKPRWRSPRLN